MSLKKCSIIFNNRTSNTYYCGETVSGFVHINLDKKKKCSGLLLKVTGEANCKWDERLGNGKSKIKTTLSNREVYFDFDINLLSPNVHTVDLMAGDHDYGFSFILPNNLPSSFEGAYGFVRYSTKLVFKQDKIDSYYKVSFTVLSNTNLNYIPNVRDPINYTTCKDFRFLLSSRGYIKVSLKTPATGYVPGQNIPIKLQLNNLSRVVVNEVKFYLIRLSSFQATCPQSCQKTETVKISHTKCDGVLKEQNRLIETTLSIPATPPTSFSCYSVVDVKYEVMVNLSTLGVYESMKFSVPIIIGTVPFERNCSESMNDLTAPPAYSDIAPPTFEETIIGKRMSDVYSEWDHSTNFSPRYPVYGDDVSQASTSGLQASTGGSRASIGGSRASIGGSRASIGGSGVSVGGSQASTSEPRRSTGKSQGANGENGLSSAIDDIVNSVKKNHLVKSLQNMF